MPIFECIPFFHQTLPENHGYYHIEYIVTNNHFLTLRFPQDYVDKDIIAGLATWKTTDHHVDLEAELRVLTDCAPPGEEARGGEAVGRVGGFL